ncbi:hypothetical protein CEXT_382181 [Caerostris extrusa]|uniref:Uncharacterized protein n=1 Tax=Caerostris extrusa TaxID=172846 RepID=A0AAV4P4K5_CAEEX|nr:hypothetical protein CEXT_382181 [Caerostris extrusa]
MQAPLTSHSDVILKSGRNQLTRNLNPVTHYACPYRDAIHTSGCATMSDLIICSYRIFMIAALLSLASERSVVLQYIIFMLGNHFSHFRTQLIKFVMILVILAMLNRMDQHIIV